MKTPPAGWAEARQEWMARLERARDVCHRAVDLTNKGGPEVPHTPRETLSRAAEQLSWQYQRLQHNRFEIAVLGLEKAGKSALLNAWLGVDLLPSKDERCTYTPTEIWSAPATEDQYYILEFWTRAEFEAAQNERRRLSEGVAGDQPTKLKAELAEIEIHRAEIEKYLGVEPDRKRFTDIRDVREELTRAIATDRAMNHACKRIQIFTHALVGERDIVFHDVPGFDSPLRSHREQAERRVAECDAILYAKRFESPDLVHDEVTLLKIADAKDPHILSDAKIIVALTRCDVAASAKDREGKLGLARSKWSGVAAARLVPVCPPVHLYRRGTGGPEVMDRGPGTEQALLRSTDDDGIDALKMVVSTYIEHDRASVVARRCRAIEAEIAGAAGEVIAALAKVYPETTEQLARSEEDAFDREFESWWAKHWSRVREQFTQHFQTQILTPGVPATAKPDPLGTRPGLASPPKTGIAAFRDAYNRQLSTRLAALPSRSPQAMKLKYDHAALGPDGVWLPERGHDELRRILAREVRDAVEEVSRSLALTLAAIAGELADKASQLLWSLPEVRSELLGSGPDHKQFEHGLSTLFLRFARPAVSLFVETPRLSMGREALVRRHKREIALLEGYYEGSEQRRKNLEMFLTVGEWVAAASPGGPVVAGAAKLAANQFEERRKTWNEPSDFEQVRRQVESDLEALGQYLSDSVFEAAAFSAYCQQELDRLKDRFVRAQDEDGLWQALARGGLRRGNLGVVAAFGKVHQEREYRRGIVVALDELRALLAASPAGTG